MVNLDYWICNDSSYGMAVTTLRQMSHTEIDDSFKSELLGTLGGSRHFLKFIFFALLRSTIKCYCLIKKNRV